MNRTRLSTKNLTFLFSASSILVALIGVKLKKNGYIFDYYMDIGIIFFVFFTFGCIGAIWVIKQETYLFGIIQGKLAVILGYLLMIPSWGLALYAIYLLITHYLR